MRVGIIGAGIAGLSIGQLLNKKHDVILFEADSRPGGLIKCSRVNGHLFHLTGGHVFNTRKQEVLDFFWPFFDKNNEFVLSNRNSVVSMPDGKIVPYPIENHVYYLDDKLVRSFIDDLISLKVERNDSDVHNFEEFLCRRFGNTLYELYFKPYNEKVWRRDLSNVPLSWLEGKLPMQSVEEMLFNNIKKIEEKQFVHSTFYYAKDGGSQFIADRMAEGLNIVYNYKVRSIQKMANGNWCIDGNEFERVIFCGNIKYLPYMTTVLDNSEVAQIESLESHGTTSVLCEIDDNPYSWIYMPGKEHDSHRIICTGNFSASNRCNGRMSATIEFTDYKSETEILDNLSRIPLNPKYLAHHFEPYTYPIQDSETRHNIKKLRQRLVKQGLYLCGRFAEWEYYNMDAAMASAIEMSKCF